VRSCRYASQVVWGQKGNPSPAGWEPFLPSSQLLTNRGRMASTPARPARESFPTDLSGAGKRDIMGLAAQFQVDFLRLHCTDILGVNKNVEVPHSQFDKALDGEIMFDGSSIEGFVRIEESDMLLVPDRSEEHTSELQS